MRTSSRKIAAVVIAVTGGMTVMSPAAHAQTDPLSIPALTRIDPVLTTNCLGGGGAAPGEIPLVGCLTL